MKGGRLAHVLVELKAHIPFTCLGAATGVACMLIFRATDAETSRRMFGVFHPAHVLLSAMVTAAIFRLHKKNAHILTVLAVGYIGAIGIATLSDCFIPLMGENILGVTIPSHADHHHNHDDGRHAEEHRHEGFLERLHPGFILDWYVVNPMALAGAFVGFFFPRTKFPHAAHVLVSTWASSFHILMNTRSELTGAVLIGAFFVLFVAVWLPCCISDIVFPVILVKPHGGDG